MLYYHIRRIVISHEDANDVLQNTFIKAWKGLKKFNRESKLSTWLYKIATNEALSFIKKNKKHQDALKNELVEKPSEYFIDEKSIEAKLEKAILILPEKQRIVFNLKYFDELKYSEISEITGTSEGALKASYHIAVKKIEEFLTS